MLNYQQNAQAAPKSTRRRLSPAEQIAAAREALARARRRQRAHDTHSKVVLGGYVLAWMRNDQQTARALLHRMNTQAPRPQDMDALADVRQELIELVRNSGNAQPAHRDAKP